MQISPHIGSCKSNKSEGRYNFGGVVSQYPVLCTKCCLIFTISTTTLRAGSIIIAVLQRRKQGTGRLSNSVKFFEAGRRHCNLSQSDSKACVIIYCVPGASDGRMGFCDIQEGQALSGLQGGCLFQEATPTIAVCPGLASSFLVKSR